MARAHSSLLDEKEEIEAVVTFSYSNFDEDELLYESLISESDGKFVSPTYLQLIVPFSEYSD